MEYWVVVPWHFSPDKLEDEKEFKKMLLEEINEMDEEERDYFLRGERPKKVVEEIMKQKYKTYEEAERAKNELETYLEEREKFERLVELL